MMMDNRVEWRYYALFWVGALALTFAMTSKNPVADLVVGALIASGILIAWGRWWYRQGYLHDRFDAWWRRIWSVVWVVVGSAAFYYVAIHFHAVFRVWWE